VQDRTLNIIFYAEKHLQGGLKSPESIRHWFKKKLVHLFMFYDA